MSKRTNPTSSKGTDAARAPVAEMVPAGKIPPQNLETEQSVLGALLLDKDAILKVVDVLTGEDFYREDHKKIYEACLALFEKHRPIDLVTLTEHLESHGSLTDVGGASYLATLTSIVTSSSHVASYAHIVKEKATLRRLISAGSTILGLGYEEERDVEEVLDEAEKALFGVAQRFHSDQFVPIKSILAQSFERIDELHKEKGKLRGVRTGFADLDALLGGLQHSDLIILAARPSIGKTSFALSIAEYVAVQEKIGVGVFSLEQSSDQLVDRMLSSVSGVDGWKLRTGNMSDEDFPKIGYAYGMLAEAPLFIDDSATINVMEIRAKARRLQVEYGLGLIVIDYLQLIQGRTRSGDPNRVQEVSEISRSLKGLARELNVPVVALSQLSRAVESRPDKRPMLSDLRDSGCLSGDTLITRADTGQQIPIAELARTQATIPVFAMDNQLKVTVHKMTKAFASGRKKVFGLRFASGRYIKASANHPFYTVDGWRRVDQLSSGVHLATPRALVPTSADTQSVSDDQLILLGHLIGDGCYLKKQPLHYTNSDRLSINIVDQTAQRAFNVTTKIVSQENWWHVYMTGHDRDHGRDRNPIRRWLKEIGIDNQHSYEKYIPEILFQLSPERQALFLKHLWSTDGCIHRSKIRPGRSPMWKLYYASSSEQLARQVQHLLLRLGIQSRLRHSQKGNYRPTWQVDVSGKNDQLRFLTQVGIFGAKARLVQRAIQELSKIQANPNRDIIPKTIWHRIETARTVANLSTRTFQAELGWAYSGTARHKHGLTRQHLNHVTSVLSDPYLKQIASSDIYWDELVAIEPLGIQEVYDATVPGVHNFVANDVIVHNSIEQDADVVMFLYRDDYYDKDTDRKDIVDVLVRKHRNGPIGEIELFFVKEQTRFRSIEKRRQ